MKAGRAGGSETEKTKATHMDACLLIKEHQVFWAAQPKRKARGTFTVYSHLATHRVIRSEIYSLIFKYLFPFPNSNPVISENASQFLTYRHTFLAPLLSPPTLHMWQYYFLGQGGDFLLPLGLSFSSVPLSVPGKRVFSHIGL